MALAGTNQDCRHCSTHYSQHYHQVVRSFKSVQKFNQPYLPSFPCPIMLTDGTNCSASNSPSIFDAGSCHGCSLYRQFLWKTHTSDSTPSGPYAHTLYLGYERAILANLEESSHELMVALASTTQGMQFHCCNDYQTDWWYIIVHPTPQSEDSLFELPKFTDPIQYQPPSKSAFLQSMPYFTHLGNDLPSCNIQNSSMILTLCIEAFTPHIEDLIQGYHLPLPSQFPDLQLQIEDLVCLVLAPWGHIVSTSYPIALASR